MQRIIISVAISIATVAGPQSQIVSASDIEFDSQQRYVSSFVIVQSCETGSATEIVESPDFAPFAETSVNEQRCAKSTGSAAGTQQSQIGAAQLAATGESSSLAGSGEPQLIYAIASSTYEVSFAIDSPQQYSLEGQLGVVVEGSLSAMTQYAVVSLREIGGETVFTYVLGADGGTTTSPVSSSGTLAPSTYTLVAAANSFIGAMTPPNRSGSASFDVILSLPQAFGDLSGDDTVGAADLAQLLASWGACDSVDNSPCPADADGDSVIGPADLAALLANWD